MPKQNARWGLGVVSQVQFAAAQLQGFGIVVWGNFISVGHALEVVFISNQRDGLGHIPLGVRRW